MNRDRISSRDEAISRLRSHCIHSIQHLNQLQSSHLLIERGLDSATIAKNNDLLRLRKALFHIQMITSWSLSVGALHVMAPDIRAAAKIIEPIIEENLNDYDGIEHSKDKPDIFAVEDEHLQPFSHPNAMILTRSGHNGGFGQPDPILAFINLYLTLMKLASVYAFGLGMTTHALFSSTKHDILAESNHITEDLNSFRLREFLRFVDVCE